MKAEAAASALDEMVPEDNRGEAAAKVNVARLPVQLAEDHRAKVELATELDDVNARRHGCVSS